MTERQLHLLAYIGSDTAPAGIDAKEREAVRAILAERAELLNTFEAMLAYDCGDGRLEIPADVASLVLKVVIRAQRGQP